MPATGNPFAWLDSAQYLPQVRKLFPRGPAWPEDPGTTAEAMRQAIADSAEAVHTLGSTLVEIEADPTQTLLLLPDWERDWGLPDPCTPLNATIAQRRAALVGKIVSNAGGNLSLLQYLETVAAAYRYSITARYGRATDGMASGPRSPAASVSAATSRCHPATKGLNTSWWGVAAVRPAATRPIPPALVVLAGQRAE